MAEPIRKKPRLVLGVRYEERKDDPPPGLKWRAVKNKETLGSIADEYHIRWVDLALYNWHTINLKEINWYLYNFMGCRKHNAKWYTFSSADAPGMLLVPDIPDSVKKSTGKSIDAVRNGSAKSDTKLKVYAFEWLAHGPIVPVSGKWLYVFSGSAGIDFGYDAPQRPQREEEGIFREEDLPGSAFTLDFPGVFHIRERPDKLEHEIFISSEEAPSVSLLHAVTGRKDAGGTPQYKVGNHWHFLSDQMILKNALEENRDKRTTHAFRPTTAVTIDLASNKRYYFLLSPVQLGPKALQSAMSNPKGLTPLLRPGENTEQWDPMNPTNPDFTKYVGPTADDIKRGWITLPVIDPYAWAENIAEVTFPYFLKEYVEWISSKKNATVTKLEKATTWSLDHLYVAKILKSVRDHHDDPESIDSELKDAAKWKRDLVIWEKELIQRNAEINAAPHRSLIQLIEWLNGPAHRIIDTAILQDTTAGSSVDAIDAGWGILHWALCTEPMIALEPGIDYLKTALTSPSSVPAYMLFRHVKALDQDDVPIIPKTQQVAFRYAYQGVLKLLALRDFVSPPPVPLTGTREEYLKKVAEYHQKYRDNLIKFLNDNKVLPVPVAPVSLPELKGGVVNWTTATAAVNGILDFVDKFTTYVIDKSISIPEDKGRILNRLAAFEKWFDDKPKWFSNGVNLGSNYVLKGVALGVSSFNLYKAITTARYDYQKEQSTVSGWDWASAVAGSALAVQDVLATVSSVLEPVLDKRKWPKLGKIFPELIITKGGAEKWPYGVGPAQVTGIFGRTFAGVNVLMMLVSGVTTTVSMGKSANQSDSRGDYTAARFYGLGALGGVIMTTGAVAYGLALMNVGWIFVATGPGASIAVILFLVGGLIAAIGTLFGWLFSSDDYEVFARKCFLGEEGDKEPRFGFMSPDGAWIGDDPPDWSHALKSRKDSWPIDKQKRAIHNLLGRFKLKTTLRSNELGFNQKDYEGTIGFEIKPGLFPPGSVVEVAFHYGSKGAQTSARILWKGGRAHKIEAGSRGDLEHTGDITAWFNMQDGSASNVKRIDIWAYEFKYEGKKGELLTTVTVSYPDLPNVIRARKLVMAHKKVQMPGTNISVDFVEANDEEVKSAIFV